MTQPVSHKVSEAVKLCLRLFVAGAALPAVDVGNFSVRVRSVTLEKEIVGICGRLHCSDYFFDCICHCWMATTTSVHNRSANQRMIPSLQSRCGRHSCAMQQRVVPRGLIRGSLGLNPPAHPIILTWAKQAAEPAGRRRRNIARADL